MHTWKSRWGQNEAFWDILLLKESKESVIGKLAMVWLLPSPSTGILTQLMMANSNPMHFPQLISEEDDGQFS